MLSSNLLGKCRFIHVQSTSQGELICPRDPIPKPQATNGAVLDIDAEAMLEENLRKMPVSSLKGNSLAAWLSTQATSLERQNLTELVKIVEEFERKELALSLARIEAHYFINQIFLPEDALLTNVDRVRSIPGIIVQGRYDMICPFVTAAELHDAWPEAQFVVVPDAGHSSLEPGICSALISATNQMRNSLVIP